MKKQKMISVVFAVMVMITIAGCGTQKTNSAKANQKAEENTSESSKENTFSGGKEPADKRAQDKDETLTKEKKADTKKTVTITAVGDCTFASTQNHGYEGSFYDYYDRYGEDYFFEGVRDTFRKDDLTLINLECVLTDSNDRVEKTFNMKGKPSYTGIMTSSSVEACSLGNNHTLDYGPQSLKDTRKALDKAGILYGYHEHTAMYTTKAGVRVGMISSNLLYQTQEYENYIKNGISALKKRGAEIIIVSCHWGIERDYYPGDYQKAAAHRIVDWGADLVVGCHPHVLQGIEYYKGKLICYSLGNFCFGGNSNPTDKNTAMFQQTFTVVGGKVKKDLQARIIPCRLSSSDDHNDYRPKVAEGDQKADILQKMREYSRPYSRLSYDADGKLGLKEEKYE